MHDPRFSTELPTRAASLWPVGFRRRVRTTACSLAALLAFAVIVGVPHLQTTYSAFPTPGRTPAAADKIAANYIGPTGWKYVEADRYAPGCPAVLFVPLGDCVDLPWPLAD